MTAFFAASTTPLTTRKPSVPMPAHTTSTTPRMATTTPAPQPFFAGGPFRRSSGTGSSTGGSSAASSATATGSTSGRSSGAVASGAGAGAGSGAVGAATSAAQG